MNYLTPDIMQQLPKWILVTLTSLTLIVAIVTLLMIFINRHMLNYSRKQLLLATRRYDQRSWYPTDTPDDDPDIRRARKQRGYSEALRVRIMRYAVSANALLTAQSICITVNTQFSIALGLFITLPVFLYLHKTKHKLKALRDEYAASQR